MNRISIVVPVFNEEGNVVALHKEIVDVCRENNYILKLPTPIGVLNLEKSIL